MDSNSNGAYYEALLNLFIVNADAINVTDIVAENIQDLGLNPSELVATDASQNLQSVTIAVTNADGTNSNLSFSGNTLTLASAMSQDLSSAGQPTFAGLTDTGLTPFELVGTDVNSKLQSLSINNGNGANFSVSGNVLEATLLQDLSTVGNPDFQSVTLTATNNVGSSLVPTVASTYNLGSATNHWANLYCDTIIPEGLNNNAFVYTVAPSGALSSSASVSNGDLLIGKSLNAPQKGALTNTDSNVVISYVTPNLQINTSTTPSFTSETLTASTNQLLMHDTTLNAPAGSACTITMPSSTCTLPGLGLNNTFTGTNVFNGTTAFSNQNGAVLSTDSITGALQKTTISNSNGCNTSFSGSTLTCSMTQDLSTSGTPTFAGLTINGSSATPTLLESSNSTTNYDVVHVANNATSATAVGMIIKTNANWGLGMRWDTTNGCILYDGNNAKNWLKQGSTSTNSVLTGNNTLDDGSGNMTVNGKLTATTSGVTAGAFSCAATSASPAVSITCTPYNVGPLALLLTKATGVSKAMQMSFQTAGTTLYNLGTDWAQNGGTDFYLYSGNATTRILALGYDVIGTVYTSKAVSTPNSTLDDGSGNATLPGTLTLSKTTNQMVLGTTHTTTLSSTAPSANRTITIPDAGANSNMCLDQGNYTIAGAWTFSQPITINENLTAYPLIANNSSGTTSKSYLRLQAGGSNMVSYGYENSGGSGAGVQIWDEHNTATWLYQPTQTKYAVATGNNTLDNGSGNMTLAGKLTLTSNGTAHVNTSYAQVADIAINPVQMPAGYNNYYITSNFSGQFYLPITTSQNDGNTLTQITIFNGGPNSAVLRPGNNGLDYNRGRGSSNLGNVTLAAYTMIQIVQWAGGATENWIL